MAISRKWVKNLSQHKCGEPGIGDLSVVVESADEGRILPWDSAPGMVRWR
jgi:hypothetical protein